VSPTPDNTPLHSTLSPSKAYQWSVCTASIGFIAANRHRIPPDRPGPAAVEGTRAHNVAEARVLREPDPGYATDEMREYGQAYADLCHTHTDGAYEWGTEVRVPLFYYTSERGTVDFYAYSPRGITVGDYKFGYDPVTVEYNKQVSIYARSLIDDNLLHWDVQDDTPITLFIFQPRLSLEPSVWTTTWADLKLFTEDSIHPAARNILSNQDTVFAPSEKVCKRCLARAICPAYSQWVEKEVAAEIFDAIEKEQSPPPITEISDQRLAWIKKNRDLIDGWLDSIDTYIDGKVLDGDTTLGFKAVLSRGGNRQWADEKKAARFLKKSGLDPKLLWSKSLISPAQALKLRKDLEIENLVTRKPGVPVVVHNSEKGEAIGTDRLKDFADELFDKSES